MRFTRRRRLLMSLPGIAALSLSAFGPARANSARLGPPVGEPWPETTEAVATSSDGTPIFYRYGGEGAVTVLFVHGWSCNHTFFGPQFAPTSRKYRFAAMDLAGHGQSGPRKQHTVAAFAEDVLAVAARFPGPLVLVVHSAGGRVACHVGPRLEEQLLGIVGFDTFQNLGLPAPTEERINASLAALRKDFVGRVEQSMSFLLPEDADPDLQRWIVQQMSSTQRDQAIAASAAFANDDPAAAVSGFSKPVWALNSDGVPTNVEQIRQVMPRFNAQVLIGQSHFLHLVNPSLLNERLLSRLEQLTG
ncbi:MAG: alpha/beta hydrolase [Pseudomonadota bacterium]